MWPEKHATFISRQCTTFCRHGNNSQSRAQTLHIDRGGWVGYGSILTNAERLSWHTAHDKDSSWDDVKGMP